MSVIIHLEVYVQKNINVFRTRSILYYLHGVFRSVIFMEVLASVVKCVKSFSAQIWMCRSDIVTGGFFCATIGYFYILD